MINQSKKNQLRFAYGWMGLLLILYIVLRIIPIGSTFLMSFKKWNLISPKKPFVGFANYTKLFADKNFMVAIKNTLVFAFVSVFLTIVFSLVLSVAIQKKFKGKGIYESLFFIPYVIAVVPASLAWKFIYDPTNGVLNYVLSWFNIPGQAWLINDKLVLWSIMLTTIWQKVGYDMVIFTVGLGEIPKDYYEASRVDGANGVQIFFKITLPLLLPVLVYLTIMNTIDAFNIFTPVYVMTQGTQMTPTSQVRVLVTEIYQNAFRYFQMGYASAQGVCLFLIVLIVSLLQFAYFRKMEK